MKGSVLSFQEINIQAEAAKKVRDLLKQREKYDAEIAAILRKQLDALGEAKWLQWCEKEFGWARSTAYRHLNPQQVDKHRDEERQRAKFGHLEAEQRLRERLQIGDQKHHIEEEVEDPANYRTSFLLRADQARRFATHSGPVTREIVATARAVSEAWSQLANKLERSL